MATISEYSYLIDEIVDYYSALRMQSISREEALKMIFREYNSEYNDEDEKPYLNIAIAIALSKKNEMTPQIRIEALQAANQLGKRNMAGFSQAKKDKLIQALSEEHIGSEAEYRRKKLYDPKWETGDTFIHAFTQPKAIEMGLSCHYIVLRKVGEYLDQTFHHVQLVYVTICSEDSIPKTGKELQSLGFLRMFAHDNGWDYLAQLYFKGKKDEESWQLQRIGCFPDAGSPSDAIDKNPLVSMPLFGTLHRNSNELHYERLVCSLMKRHGISYNN